MKCSGSKRSFCLSFSSEARGRFVRRIGSTSLRRDQTHGLRILRLRRYDFKVQSLILFIFLRHKQRLAPYSGPLNRLTIKYSESVK